MDANGSTILVKIGGSTLGFDDTSFDDIAELQRRGAKPVIVHGGGPAITSWMAKLGIRAEFVRGLRVTDEPSLEVAAAVLAGLINKQLVAALQAAGAKVIGLSGADANLLRGTVTDSRLGFVAGSLDVDPSAVKALLDAGYAPVIAPIAVDASDAGQLLNVNADSAAGAIAAAIGAQHLVFLTDVDGILDANGRLIERVPLASGEQLVNSGIVKGGMIPKLEACIEARTAGAKASIVNGASPRALLACLDGSAAGTTVV